MKIDNELIAEFMGFEKIQAEKSFALYLFPSINKWGNKIFESRGYNDPWDGTFNGSPLPSDTYYFVIDLGTGKPPINGPVTIVR